MGELEKTGEPTVSNDLSTALPSQGGDWAAEVWLKNTILERPAALPLIDLDQTQAEWKQLRSLSEADVRKMTEEKGKEEFPNDPQLAALAAREMLFSKYHYEKPLSTDEILELARTRTQRKAQSEYPNDPLAAQLLAQQIMHSKYAEGPALQQNQDDYLIQAQTKKRAEALFQNYQGADKAELVQLTECDLLFSEGFPDCRLSAQDKTRLGKAIAAIHGQTYSEEPLANFQKLNGRK